MTAHNRPTPLRGPMTVAPRHAGDDASRPTGTPPAERTTFALERFAWDAPDRLEVSGWFSGLGAVPPDAPVLVVRGSEATHRLPAVPERLSGSPEDGRRWCAAFAWQEAPAAFDVAELELGADIVVELPEPRPERHELGDQILEVRRTRPVRGGPPHEPVMPSGGAERLRLQADLLAAQEEVRALRDAMLRTRGELARAQENLEAERERNAADAERFREALAGVRGSAEEAMAAEESATQRLRIDLQEARAEIEALRERVALPGRLAEEADALRSELDATRTRADDARARLQEARRVAADARAEAEHLLGRLTTIENALDDHG